MRILINKALTHLYAVGKSNSMLTCKYCIVLDIKGKHNFKLFPIYTLQKYLPARELTLTNLKFQTKGLRYTDC